MLSTILLIILILLLLGALPAWPYSRGWGYGPSGFTLVLVVVVVVLLATGRISSEMLAKAAKMEVPIVASRTSATSLSIALARAWNITVIGYVRRNSLRVYTAPQRFLQAAEAVCSGQPVEESHSW